MNIKSSTLLRFALIATFGCCVAFGVNACKTVSDPSRPVVNGQTLDAGMSDEQLIRVFGLDIKTAEVKRVQGKDGTSLSYRSGVQEVTITRSTVSGVSVWAKGPISGTWTVGGD